MDHRHREVRKVGLVVVETSIQMDLAGRDEELRGLLDYMSCREKQAKLESHRWAGYAETHPAVQVLDILQESTAILRKHNDLLLTVALVFAVPLSTLLLSHVLLLVPLMESMVRTVQLAAEKRFHGLISTGDVRKLAESAMSNVVGVPFSALFSPLLKAGVAYVVATTYSRKKLILADVFNNLQKTWSLLLHTFMWTFSVYLFFTISVSSVLYVVWTFASSGSGTVLFTCVMAILAAILLSGLALSIVVCNFAYVVSILEGLHGREALAQSVRLILKGRSRRLEVALLLFLLTNVSATLVDMLFEFHIIRGDASVVYDKYWEAPLLVCMHSFVHLFDAIMVSVFYFICKSTSEQHLIPQYSLMNSGLASWGSPMATSGRYSISFSGPS